MLALISLNSNLEAAASPTHTPGWPLAHLVVLEHGHAGDELRVDSARDHGSMQHFARDVVPNHRIQNRTVCVGKEGGREDDDER